MKLLRIVLIIALLLGVLVFIKVKFFSGTVSNIPVKGGGKEAGTVKVFVAKKEKFIEKIMTTGTVMANEEAELRPEVAGKVVKLFFSEGTFVPQHTLLLKINDADLKAQLQKIELQITLAEEKEVRQKKILELEGISKEEYDALVNQVNTLKSDRDYLFAQIRKTEIRAPFSGVIGLRNISEGTYVSPTTVVATMQQLNPLKIDFSIPEKYSRLLKKGDVLTFEVEGVDKVFSAKIIAIEPKIDLATRTLKIRALSYDHEDKLLPGNFVKVEVSKENDERILIPTEALIPELKGNKVFFYKSGKAIPGKVIAGSRTDTKVVMLEGVNAGDTIITSGIMQLKAESPVNILEITNP